MSRSLEVRPEAEADIEDAFNHYREVSPALAISFLDELNTSFGKIVDHPTHYQGVHKDLHRVLLTRFPYAVFYSFSDRSTVVFGVFHQASDPKRWER